MSDDTNNKSKELETWIDPAIEAHIVALVLGEASDFERDDLENQMRERPELRAFYQRMIATHELLAESEKPTSASTESWRMSEDRRQAMLETLRSKTDTETEKEAVTVVKMPSTGRKKSRPMVRVLVPFGIAAAIAVLMLPATSRMWSPAETDSRKVERQSDMSASGWSEQPPKPPKTATSTRATKDFRETVSAVESNAVESEKLGRLYAWSDDESSKVNLNEKQSDAKWDLPRLEGQSTFPVTPANPVSGEWKTEIEATREFLYPTEFDPPEVPQNFTTNSRAPELTLFGTPRVDMWSVDESSKVENQQQPHPATTSLSSAIEPLAEPTSEARFGNGDAAATSRFFKTTADPSEQGDVDWSGVMDGGTDDDGVKLRIAPKIADGREKSDSGLIDEQQHWGYEAKQKGGAIDPSGPGTGSDGFGGGGGFGENAKSDKEALGLRSGSRAIDGDAIDGLISDGKTGEEEDSRRSNLFRSELALQNEMERKVSEARKLSEKALKVEKVDEVTKELFRTSRDETRATMIRQVDQTWETPPVPVVGLADVQATDADGKESKPAPDQFFFGGSDDLDGFDSRLVNGGTNIPVPTGGNPITSGLRSGGNAIASDGAVTNQRGEEQRITGMRAKVESGSQDLAGATEKESKPLFYSQPKQKLSGLDRLSILTDGRDSNEVDPFGGEQNEHGVAVNGVVSVQDGAEMLLDDSLVNAPAQTAAETASGGRKVATATARPGLAAPTKGPVVIEDEPLGFEVGVGYDSKYMFRGVEFGDDSVHSSVDYAAPLNDTVDLNKGAWYETIEDKSGGITERSLVRVNPQPKAEELGIDRLMGEFNTSGSERVFGAGGTVGNHSNNEPDPSDFHFVRPTGAVDGVARFDAEDEGRSKGKKKNAQAASVEAVKDRLGEVASDNQTWGIAGAVTTTETESKESLNRPKIENLRRYAGQKLERIEKALKEEQSQEKDEANQEELRGRNVWARFRGEGEESAEEESLNKQISEPFAISGKMNLDYAVTDFENVEKSVNELSRLDENQTKASPEDGYTTWASQPGAVTSFQSGYDNYSEAASQKRQEYSKRNSADSEDMIQLPAILPVDGTVRTNASQAPASVTYSIPTQTFFDDVHVDLNDDPDVVEFEGFLNYQKGEAIAPISAPAIVAAEEPGVDANSRPQGKAQGGEELDVALQPDSSMTPSAQPIPGKKGQVYSPFAPGKPIDVSGYPAETKMRCPYTGKEFRVPEFKAEPTAPKVSARNTAALEIETAAEPFSTFSLHVSDVSFKLAQAALLEKGEWPQAEKIRVEEFVNAFDYGDPPAAMSEKVACQMEQAAHPFLSERNLLRVSMRTAAIGRDHSQPLRLTVLLDLSGSMERADREASVTKAMEALAGHLSKKDTVTLIGFAREPQLLADRYTGDRAMELVKLVDAAPSEGGTNLEEALKLADEVAKRQFDKSGQNRIVLLTDGAANLGDAEPESLSKRIVALRQAGIGFDACGVGADGLNDAVLEALTRDGDGRYYFLNRPQDADEGFVKQLAGALRPAAKNVKVQVKFNPDRVPRYRLLGFEKHILKKEDFRNDSVDAAEMASAEAGVAVYQYQVDPGGSGDVGEVFVRFQDMSTGEMVERSWPIPFDKRAPSFDEAAPALQLAGCAAFLGEKLRGGPEAGNIELGELMPVARAVRTHCESSPKVNQLIEMMEKARSLQAGE